MKETYKKVEIVAYYGLEGRYNHVFEHNPLHGKTYENVNVEIETKTSEIYGVLFEINVIHIEGEEPIECALLDAEVVDETLILSICQDWG